MTAGPVVAAQAHLPRYTVMGPLHREEERVGPWLDAVAALEYPQELLDVLLLVEEDDAATRAAAERELARRGHPAWLRILVVPVGGPRTKPHALQRGLAAARGAVLVVYDAEDVPDRDQLMAAAAAFAAEPPDTACLQARPIIAAGGKDLFGRLMAAEYRLWHGGFLPGLARAEAPVPLAGTSNHLRADALRALGGWDPHNVAEDADLGVRIARAGLRTRMLPSSTLEDSTPDGIVAWLRQRSRWSKGFAQTWRAARRPRGALRHELGRAGAAWLHLTLGGTLAVQLTSPLLWGAAALGPALRGIRGRSARPTPTEAACLTAAAAGVLARLAAMRAFRAGEPGLGRAGLVAPGYWLLEGVAAWRGMYGLVRHPDRWDKTAHPMGAGHRAPEG